MMKSSFWTPLFSGFSGSNSHNCFLQSVKRYVKLQFSHLLSNTMPSWCRGLRFGFVKRSHISLFGPISFGFLNLNRLSESQAMPVLIMLTGFLSPEGLNWYKDISSLNIEFAIAPHGYIFLPSASRMTDDFKKMIRHTYYVIFDSYHYLHRREHSLTMVRSSLPTIGCRLLTWHIFCDFGRNSSGRSTCKPDAVLRNV